MQPDGYDSNSGASEYNTNDYAYDGDGKDYPNSDYSYQYGGDSSSNGDDRENVRIDDAVFTPETFELYFGSDDGTPFSGTPDLDLRWTGGELVYQIDPGMSKSELSALFSTQY